ncbi:MAG TPA: MnmC family methyltransferase [Chthoniobacterales bacterium]|jgi:queuine tRNA-ribosyltransferase|nr:MnmC family methyltransferase [Chthoniobacterales bacterium]
MKGDASLRLGDYEIHRAWEGFASIRQISSGEIMHSRTDPIREARELYVEQSRLADRLQSESLILWDVGLGAAANAIAAIESYEESSSTRPFRIVSFENDLDSLRLALANPESFPYLRVEAANAIVADGEWRDRGLRWNLVLGDFVERMTGAPTPDVIFYDMFSTKTSAELWTAGTFRKLFGICAGRAVELFTYTCSTANRAALLAAGFFIARGRNAGDKIETTIAVTPAALDATRNHKRDCLSRDWLAKWERSAAKFPSDIAPNERSAFEKMIREHEQFRNSPGPERLPSTT